MSRVWISWCFPIVEIRLEGIRRHACIEIFLINSVSRVPQGMSIMEPTIVAVLFIISSLLALGITWLLFLSVKWLRGDL